MKKLFYFILVFLVSHTVHGQYKGDSWSKVNSSGSGTLTVVYYQQPGLIQNVDGKVKGVCVDILNDFANYVKTKYGKTITIEYAGEEKDFARFVKVSHTTPNILGVANTSITEERRKIMKFSPPYMRTQVALLTNEKAPSLNNLNEIGKTFTGFKAQVISGTTHVKLMEKIKKDHFPLLQITYASSGEEIINNLTTDPKLFSILDFTEYVGIVKRKLPVKRQDVDLGEPDDLGFIMSKQSDWDVLFNEFLTAEYRTSIAYKKIIADNLGSAFLKLVR